MLIYLDMGGCSEFRSVWAFRDALKESHYTCCYIPMNAISNSILKNLYLELFRLLNTKGLLPIQLTSDVLVI